MMTAVAIDDEPPALKVLSTFCSTSQKVLLQEMFTNTDKAFAYLNDTNIDLIFLDINMPAISGLDFYKKLTHKPLLILTTAYSAFALEAFNMNAVDYLLKPFSAQRFEQATDKAYHLFQKNHMGIAPGKPTHITVKVDYSLTRIELSQITFIEGLDDYLKIHFITQKPLVVRLTLKALMDKLPKEDFLRVHRSYIVATNKIESVRNRTIQVGTESIAIGFSYAKTVLDKLQGS